MPSEKNFDTCQLSGKQGMAIGDALRTSSSSESSGGVDGVGVNLYRPYYSCCAVTAAIVYSRCGFFLEALLVLYEVSYKYGMERNRISAFFDYVEYNAKGV